MKVAVAAKADEVEFQRLALNHAHIRHIRDIDRRIIRLTRNRTERRELRTVELHPIIALLVAILKGLQNLRTVIIRIRYILIAQERYLACLTRFLHQTPPPLSASHRYDMFKKLPERYTPLSKISDLYHRRFPHFLQEDFPVYIESPLRKSQLSQGA